MCTILKGVLLYLDKPNANGRIYSSKAVEKALIQAKPRIESRSMFTELFPTERLIYTNLDNVGGVLIDMYVEDDTLYGEVELVDTKIALRYSKYIEMHPTMLRLKSIVREIIINTERRCVDYLEFLSVDLVRFDFFDEDTICKVIKK